MPVHQAGYKTHLFRLIYSTLLSEEKVVACPILKHGYLTQVLPVELAYLNRNISRYGSSLLEVVLELGKAFHHGTVYYGSGGSDFPRRFFSLLNSTMFQGHFSIHRVDDCLVFQPRSLPYKASRYRKKYISSGQTR